MVFTGWMFFRHACEEEALGMADEERPMAGMPDEGGEPSDADYLLALNDEVDRLRRLPSAVGVEGLVLFIALVAFIFNATELGLLWSFGSALVVASPGLILVGKDLLIVRRRRWLETKIFELEALAVEDGGRVPKQPGGLEGDQDALT
jgi:hypothetical protein